MKRTITYLVCLVIAALPWLFLFEAFPMSYNRISVANEILIEILMFLLLIASLRYLKKDRKRIEQNDKTMKVFGFVVFVLTFLTAFLLGAILVIIGIVQFL